MSQPYTGQIIPLELPILGMNTRDGLSRMNPSYSPWVENFEPQTQVCKIRPGMTTFHTFSNSMKAANIYGKDIFYWVENGASSAIFQLEPDGTDTNVQTTVTSTEVWSGYFAGRIAFCTDGGGGKWYVYNGSSWSSLGFDDGSSTIYGKFTSHKGRVYIVSGKTLFFSELEAITGTCSQVDLIFDFHEPEPKGGTSNPIAFIATLSSPGDRADEQYLCIGSYSGEILVYAGDNPAANNWELVAKLKTSPILEPELNDNSHIVYRNDIWVMTTTGIHSVKGLLTASADAPQAYSMSYLIDSHYTKVCKEVLKDKQDSDDVAISCAYLPTENLLFFCVNGWVDKSGAYDDAYCTMFVFNGHNNAWTLTKIPTKNGTGKIDFLLNFNNSISYFDGRLNVQYRDTTVHYDEIPSGTPTQAPYTARMKGAPYAFGTQNKTKKLAGFELVYKTSLTSIDVGAIKNFHRNASNTGTLRPNSFDSVSVDYVSVGEKGVYFQYELELDVESDSATGFELYALGANVS